VFPALTCTAQASFRTASEPAAHGLVANGVFNRQLNRPMFWEQSSRLVAGPRIWDEFRSQGRRVGMMFWQQSLGESVDLVLSPAPIHKHHGGMIQDCYSQPPGLYARLCERLGGAFKLRQYWGPLASAKVGDWIAAATAAVMADRELACDLLLTYLPSLDYDLQRFGPRHAKSRAALKRTLAQLGLLVQAAKREGYDVLVFGDYAIANVSAAAFPNRALLEAGLMSVRDVRGMLYPDFHTSRAFAMVDHEIAHVYLRDPADMPAVRQTLQALPVQCLPEEEKRGQAPISNDEIGASPHFSIVAKEGHWLAYPWWTDKRQAPDFAAHVDIHNKPGYDPCELFFGWPPPSVSQDTARIRGSHGRVGPGREIAWASTLPLGEACTLLDLAAAVQRILT
jgi:predicted AlkP superfamily pyrophosphatase or phosphodiesterase